MEDRTDERSGRHENPRGTGSRAGGSETATGSGASARAEARNAERERGIREWDEQRILSLRFYAGYDASAALRRDLEYYRNARRARRTRIAIIAADAISIYE